MNALRFVSTSSVPLSSSCLVLAKATTARGLGEGSFSLTAAGETLSSSTSTTMIRTLKTWRKNRALRQRFHRDTYRQPTLREALVVPRGPQEMDNSALATLGALGNFEANKELVKRHIMAVDQVDYATAMKTFELIVAENRKGTVFLTAPYFTGIGVAATSAVLSVPLVFNVHLAKYFNHHYVTTEVPPPEDLETWLEVGSWTWNWMEPPLGAISFVLLALQFSRAQMQNLGIKPYTEFVKNWRARKLAQAFPQYDANILIQYSESTDIYEQSPPS